MSHSCQVLIKQNEVEYFKDYDYNEMKIEEEATSDSSDNSSELGSIREDLNTTVAIKIAVKDESMTEEINFSPALNEIELKMMFIRNQLSCAEIDSNHQKMIDSRLNMRHKILKMKTTHEKKRLKKFRELRLQTSLSPEKVLTLMDEMKQEKKAIKVLKSLGWPEGKPITASRQLRKRN